MLNDAGTGGIVEIGFDRLGTFAVRAAVAAAEVEILSRPLLECDQAVQEPNVRIRLCDVRAG